MFFSTDEIKEEMDEEINTYNHLNIYSNQKTNKANEIEELNHD